MSKYDRLGSYLSEKQDDIVPIRFAEIERILGFSLPRSAYVQRTWWSNNQNNSVMTRVWRKAGFRSEQVDMTRMKLVFRRVAPDAARAPQPPMRELAMKSAGTGASPSPVVAEGFRLYSTADDRTGARCRHPIYGALKGHIRLVAGTDLTEPADPEWGERGRRTDPK